MIYESPAGWYVLLAVGIILWLIFLKLGKAKIKANLKMGLLMIVVAFVVEIIGIGLNLWTYTTGNWPLLLWPTYFVYGLLAYSLFKIVERKVK